MASWSNWLATKQFSLLFFASRAIEGKLCYTGLKSHSPGFLTGGISIKSLHLFYSQLTYLQTTVMTISAVMRIK